MKNFNSCRIVSVVFLSLICNNVSFAGHSGSKLVAEEGGSTRGIDRMAERLGNSNIDNKNVVELLMSLRKIDPVGLKKLIELFNVLKMEQRDFSSVLPSAIISFFPENVLCWLHENGLIGPDGKIVPQVYEALDLTYGIFSEGIENAQNKTCKTWCQTCWCQNAPRIIELTVELVLPILSKVLINLAIKNGANQEQVYSAIFADNPSISKSCDRLSCLRDISETIRHSVIDRNGNLLDWTDLVRNIKIRAEMGL